MESEGKGGRWRCMKKSEKESKENENGQNEIGKCFLLKLICSLIQGLGI